MGHPQHIDINIQFASMRQIHAAIEHYRRQDYECAITLAAAGEGILPDTDKPHFRQKVKELEAEFKKLPEGTSTGAAKGNDFINWLKHGTLERSGPKIENARIEVGVEVVVAIYRGVTKFEAVYGFLTPQMLRFKNELIEEAYSKRPGFGEW